jgi:hypothetical protein
MVLLALLAACSEEPPPENHHLSDLFRPQVQLNTGFLPGGAEQIQLFVHPLTPGVCHPIPTLTATLDGKAMTRLHGLVPGENGYDRDCSVFEFTLDPKDIVAGPTNALVITDGVSTITMEVANLFAPRTATASATDVKPGDTVTLAWSPATDVLADKGDFGVLLEAGGKRASVKRQDLVVAPGSVAFPVPEGVSGDVTASVFGTAAMQPPVTRCEGLAACKVSREYDVAPFSLRLP